MADATTGDGSMRPGVPEHEVREETSGSDMREARPLMERLMVYPLDEEISRLRTEPQWQEGEKNTLALAKTGDLRVLLTTLRAGSALTEFDGEGSATIQVLSGRLVVTFEDASDVIEAGEFAVLEGGTPWRIEAAQEAALLLTLAWRPEWSPDPDVSGNRD